jgi:hypothetical protein
VYNEIEALCASRGIKIIEIDEQLKNLAGNGICWCQVTWQWVARVGSKQFTNIFKWKLVYGRSHLKVNHFRWYWRASLCIWFPCTPYGSSIHGCNSCQIYMQFWKHVTQRGCILPDMYSAYKLLHSACGNGTEMIGSIPTWANSCQEWFYLPSGWGDCGVRSMALDDLLCFIRPFSNRTIPEEFPCQKLTGEISELSGNTISKKSPWRAGRPQVGRR